MARALGDRNFPRRKERSGTATVTLRIGGVPYCVGAPLLAGFDCAVGAAIDRGIAGKSEDAVGLQLHRSQFRHTIGLD